MRVFVFGNGNISFADFQMYYQQPLNRLLVKGEDLSFLVCDFRGADTLTLEFLKTQSPHVQVCHIGERPRYLPDVFKTQVSHWQLIGGFASDKERDQYALEHCTHFLAMDFNTDAQRKSGTLKNIEKCIALGKKAVLEEEL